MQKLTAELNSRQVASCLKKVAYNLEEVILFQPSSQVMKTKNTQTGIDIDSQDESHSTNEESDELDRQSEDEVSHRFKGESGQTEDSERTGRGTETASSKASESGQTENSDRTETGTETASTKESENESLNSQYEEHSGSEFSQQHEGSFMDKESFHEYFGSLERLERLESHFKKINAENINIIIFSKLRKKQDIEKLLDRQ